MFLTFSYWSFLNTNRILSIWKKLIIPFFCIVYSFQRISSKPNFFILSVSFCCHSKRDRRRLYNAIFILSILFCLLYLGGILINIILSNSAYTNALIASNCSVLRSNLAIIASKTNKEVTARVIAWVGRSRCFCKLLYTTSLAFYFCSWLCLLVLYFKTYLHSSFWWLFALALLTNSQNLNCYLCCYLWIFISL